MKVWKIALCSTLSCQGCQPCCRYMKKKFSKLIMFCKSFDPWQRFYVSLKCLKSYLPNHKSFLWKSSCFLSAKIDSFSNRSILKIFSLHSFLICRNLLWWPLLCEFRNFKNLLPIWKSFCHSDCWFVRKWMPEDIAHVSSNYYHYV